jgi:DNA-directed RNA polymerase specialized sigma24 family protein
VFSAGLSMMSEANFLIDWTLANLPKLRRVARALSGDQGCADSIVAETLTTIGAWPDAHEIHNSDLLLIDVVRVLIGVWMNHKKPNLQAASRSPELCKLDALLQGLPDRVRCAYVLSQLENIDIADVAVIMQTDTVMIKLLVRQSGA